MKLSRIFKIAALAAALAVFSLQSPSPEKPSGR